MRGFFIDFFKIMIPLGFFSGIMGFLIFSMAQRDIDKRAEQKAACIAAGGKYAESQKHNASPTADYCIRN